MKSVQTVLHFLFPMLLGFIWGYYVNYMYHDYYVNNRYNSFQHTIEELYQKDLKLQKPLVEKLLARKFPEMIESNREINRMYQINQESIIGDKAIYHVDLPYPWFVFRPIWNCPFKQRIGEVFDGGKNLCNLERLRATQNCQIYSFGSNGLVEFKVELRSLTECDISIFDPTVANLPVLPEGIRFYQWGLSDKAGNITVNSKNYPAYSMTDIMDKLGHKHIQLLKMDIDGYEWQTFERMPSNVLQHIDEISIELHWHNLPETVAFFEKMQTAGFRIFSNEPNLFYRTMPAAGIEYSFVKLQYTF